jgi:hypothetical protein
VPGHELVLGHDEVELHENELNEDELDGVELELVAVYY